MKELMDDVMEVVSADEQYFRDLYNAQKKKPVDVKQQYIDWINANYRIGNGKMLLERMENTRTQWEFIRDHGLPDDVELI